MATEAVKITYIEAAAPSTPASGRTVVYTKTDGLVYSKDDAGVETLMSSGASTGIPATIIDAAGDLIVGSAADTAARLAIGGTDGMALRRASGALAWNLPPSHEFDYVQFTSNVNITNTAEASADVVVTSNAVTYDGSTIVRIEFQCPAVFLPNTAGLTLRLWLYEKVGAGAAASIGKIGEFINPAAANWETVCNVPRRMTPSAASIIYSIRGTTSAGTSIVAGGAGGAGAAMPGSIRITKV